MIVEVLPIFRVPVELLVKPPVPERAAVAVMMLSLVNVTPVTVNVPVTVRFPLLV